MAEETVDVISKVVERYFSLTTLPGPTLKLCLVIRISTREKYFPNISLKLILKYAYFMF